MQKEYSMPNFTPLKSDNDLKEIIKTAFDMNLDISGDWGYTEAAATLIHSTTTPITQLEHIFASMRAYTEMSMTLQKEERYGSINVNEKSREEISSNSRLYHKVTYEVTAMKEEAYNNFIKEYKEKSEEVGFDMADHFQRRKEATIKREVIHWFDVSDLV